MEAAHLEGSEKSLAPTPGQAVPGASQPGGQHDLQAACAQGGIVWTKNPPPKKTAGEAVTVVSIVSAGLGLFVCFPVSRTNTNSCIYSSLQAQSPKAASGPHVNPSSDSRLDVGGDSQRLTYCGSRLVF